MNEELLLPEETVPAKPCLLNPPDLTNNKPPADAKQLRTASVGALLDGAYQGASMLKLKPNEIKQLTEPFPDECVEIRPFDGIIYISHMQLRQRLWEVFGPTEVAEICRERAKHPDTNEIMVDLVLMARGKFLAEAIGTAKWFPNNQKQSFGDAIESAWSEALRRCCKRIWVGTEVWKPDYVRRWLATNAVEFQGKWRRKDSEPPKAGRKAKEYALKDPAPERATAAKEDDDDIPF